MARISLHGKKAAGRLTVIDDSDFELASAHRWHVYEKTAPGRRPNGPYAVTTFGQSKIQLHTLITGWPFVDHINHDTLDNRRINLRQSAPGPNAHNTRPQLGSSSRFKGVTWHKQLGKWQAGIAIGGRFCYLGCFLSEEDAALAYNAAALEAHGACTYLNEVTR